MSETTFLLLVAGYVLGGLVCLGVSVTGLGGGSSANRLVTGAVGVFALGYAGYLLFTPTESVWVLPFLLILPAIIAFKAVRAAVMGPVRQTA